MLSGVAAAARLALLADALLVFVMERLFKLERGAVGVGVGSVIERFFKLGAAPRRSGQPFGCLGRTIIQTIYEMGRDFRRGPYLISDSTRENLTNPAQPLIQRAYISTSTYGNLSILVARTALITKLVRPRRMTSFVPTAAES